MRIYQMTATFGKLEHETLTLQPGLNVIHAPNEWGKSTWCAFLVAMLYGLDTRAKSTKSALADKERYVPWSGSPMAGRIDLNWNGRDITIERKTKGRIPLGQFRAYETDSGLEVGELTAANCGARLLGVERSVFLQSGFIRLNQLPVTDDESLRRRLNALVTTGDESGTAERLAKNLRELKNRVRYNRTGLLPQAEEECRELEGKIRELDNLAAQSEKIKEKLLELEALHSRLENHRTALAYRAAREGQRRVAAARLGLEESEKQFDQAKEACEALPPREHAQQVLSQIGKLQERQNRLQLELRMLPQPGEPVSAPEVFSGMDGAEAVGKASSDGIRYEVWQKQGRLPWLLGLLISLCGGIGAVWYRIPGLICAGVGALLLIAGLIYRGSCRRKARELEAHYGSSEPARWLASAEEYAQRLRSHNRSAGEYARQKQALENRLQELYAHIQQVTGGQGLESCRRDWEKTVDAWDARDSAFQTWQQARHHYEALKAVAKDAQPPEFPDEMDCTEAETLQRLSECADRRHSLENRLGQYQGLMEALGERNNLTRALAEVKGRITQLEETYTALSIAQETLAEASAELQRRFAPKIAKRTQELMSRMTKGRYTRLNLGTDLALRAGAEQEDTLRESLWRSDGTVDQLYLALRLAVSEALSPEAPIILDDALVRFDDERLKSALEILREEAQRKQVLLFTCHRRELELL